MSSSRGSPAPVGVRPMAVTGGHDRKVRTWDSREGVESGRNG